MLDKEQKDLELQNISPGMDATNLDCIAPFQGVHLFSVFLHIKTVAVIEHWVKLLIPK